MSTRNSFITRIFASILIALLFVELGIWQLHRAEDSKKAGRVVLNQSVLPLTELASAGTNLSPKAINRMVEVNGSYAKLYSAPGQVVGTGKSKKRQTLEVRMLKISGGRGILVVRGLEPISAQAISEKVKVIGRLYPRQDSDQVSAENLKVPNTLSRIDPALVVGDSKLSLFDGYVIAQVEQNAIGQTIRANRIPAAPLISRVAGYYWQHLTYVIIWWLLALLMLLAPFYERLRDKIKP